MKVDIYFGNPDGIPSVLAYHRHKGFWENFMKKGNKIGRINDVFREYKGKFNSTTHAERIYIRGLSRRDKESFKAAFSLMDKDAHLYYLANLTLPEEKEYTVQYAVAEMFYRHIDKEMDESPLSSKEHENYPVKYPWYSLAICFLRSDKMLNHNNGLPVERWMMDALDVAETATDEDTMHHVAAMMYVCSMWMGSSVPMMALVERYPAYQSFFADGFSADKKDSYLPEAGFSMYSQDAIIHSSRLKIQYEIASWIRTVGGLTPNDIDDSLSRLEEIGRGARRMSEGAAVINKKMISMSVSSLFIQVRKVMELSPEGVLDSQAFSEDKVQVLEGRWHDVAKICDDSNEQEFFLALLGERIETAGSYEKQLKGVAGKIARLWSDASACADPANPFANLDKLKSLKEQHEDQVKLALDTLKDNRELLKLHERLETILEDHQTKPEQAISDAERLAAEIAEIRGSLEDEQAKAMELERVNNNLRETQHQIEAKSKALAEQLASLKDSVAQHNTDGLGENARKTFVRVMRDPASASPTDILMVLGTLYPERLVILPSAWESAEESSSFQQTERLLSLLTTLVNEYLDAINEGQSDAMARRLFAGSYSAKESETVMRSPHLSSYRKFHHEGEVFDMPQHLVIGVAMSIQVTMRVHFCVHDKKIIIGHCGEHLPLRNVS